ncbi:MAG: Sensor protein, partial [Myxococcales bacterium]|nr:Sensor protein [Myxococcales bacterium]
ARRVRQMVISERLASIGQLAAGVAHEINNPVSYVLSSQSHLSEQLAIVGELGELITSGADAATIRVAFERAGGAGFVSQLREAAEEIRGGGVRIRDIVRDIWSIARADETPMVVDLNEAIRSAIRVAASQVKHHAQIIERLEDGVSTMGNLGRMSQVFVNLLVNAAEAFERPDKNQITVSSERRGDKVYARVADNGPGIRPDHLGRIFDAFPTSPGTGFGLAMSREIVRRSGGDIQVDSVVGQGATFTIVLPYASRPEVVVCVRALEPSQSMPRTTRILFVDDEPSIRRGYQRAFGRSYDVALAVDGEDAWRILTETPKFDLVFCDLLMPNTGGMELYRRVCELRPELAEAFVFVTGGVSEPEIQEFLKSCGRTMLEKPFDMKELKRIIEARRPGPRSRG